MNKYKHLILSVLTEKKCKTQKMDVYSYISLPVLLISFLLSYRFSFSKLFSAKIK